VPAAGAAPHGGVVRLLDAGGDGSGGAAGELVAVHLRDRCHFGAGAAEERLFGDVQLRTVDLAFDGPRGRQVHGGVEHTAPLVRGSSGGPLANADGRVVGLNTHRIARGFYVARPVDAALIATVDDLAAGKSVVRPRLGIALAPPEVAAKLRASVGLPPREGLLVRGVEPEGPADNAGIAEGDLLVGSGETALTSIESLHQVLDSASETLSLTVVRGTDERTVAVTLS